MNLTEDDYQPTDEDVRILREWLKKMPHLLQDYDDTFLAIFIKGKKGSLQKAKYALEKFNAAGLLFPEFLGHLDILNPISQEYLKGMFLFPLEKRLDNGAHVFVLSCDFDFKDTKSKKTNLIEMWRYWRMFFYVHAWENNPYTKTVTICDWKSLRVGHAKDINPVLLGRMMASHKCIPVRIVAVYNINVPPSLEWALNMLKSVVTKKLADRLHFISSIDTLYQHIPRDMLPKDYGGPQEDIKTMHSRWMRKVESYRDRLIEENRKMRELDHLRPIKEDPLDMIGTFKALNVD